MNPAEAENQSQPQEDKPSGNVQKSWGELDLSKIHKIEILNYPISILRNRVSPYNLIIY